MLSMPHLVVLFVIALVIFGPQKLPELARMLGKATAEFRRITNDFRYTLEDEVRNLERQTRIHEEEIAAAARAVEPTPAPPQGAIARDFAPETPADIASHEVKPEQALHPEASETPAHPVAPPLEKPSDDAGV